MLVPLAPPAKVNNTESAPQTAVLLLLTVPATGVPEQPVVFVPSNTPLEGTRFVPPAAEALAIFSLICRLALLSQAEGSVNVFNAQLVFTV
ncbi:hypothetical protein D9M68_941990 [compost metagenome]